VSIAFVTIVFTINNVTKRFHLQKMIVITEEGIRMGGGMSKELLHEFKDFVDKMSKEDTMSSDEIQHLYSIFTRYASPISSENLLRVQRKNKASTVFPYENMQPMDFKKYVDTTFPKKQPAEEKYDHLFRGFDYDSDGEISFRDFLMFHLAVDKRVREPLEHVVFAMFDVDQRGALSTDGIVEVISNSTRWMEETDPDSFDVCSSIAIEAQNIVEIIAAKNDDAITKEEFLTACRKHPALLERMGSLA